jgi:hypothetical protein
VTELNGLPWTFRKSLKENALESLPLSVIGGASTWLMLFLKDEFVGVIVEGGGNYDALSFAGIVIPFSAGFAAITLGYHYKDDLIKLVKYLQWCRK